MTSQDRTAMPVLLFDDSPLQQQVLTLVALSVPFCYTVPLPMFFGLGAERISSFEELQKELLLRSFGIIKISSPSSGFHNAFLALQ